MSLPPYGQSRHKQVRKAKEQEKDQKVRYKTVTSSNRSILPKIGKIMGHEMHYEHDHTNKQH